jgi:hypothetical protein
MKKLFLDDIRNPKDAAGLAPQAAALYFTDWDIVRNYQEFIDYISTNGIPDIISFDHDLADEHYQDLLSDQNWYKPDANINLSYDNYNEKTGLDCAKWLVDFCIDGGFTLPQYIVHSANPAGRKNIQSYLDNAKNHI